MNLNRWRFGGFFVANLLQHSPPMKCCEYIPRMLGQLDRIWFQQTSKLFPEIILRAAARLYTYRQSFCFIDQFFSSASVIGNSGCAPCYCGFYCSTCNLQARGFGDNSNNKPWCTSEKESILAPIHHKGFDVSLRFASAYYPPKAVSLGLSTYPRLHMQSEWMFHRGRGVKYYLLLYYSRIFQSTDDRCGEIVQYCE